jgi:uncharacterized protein YjcR
MAPIRRGHTTATERVADKFGGFAELARLLGAAPSTVRSWNSRDGGRIPSRYHTAILALARKHKKRVRPGDLVNV